MQAVDVDLNLTAFKNHLRNHSDAYYRTSSTGNIHALIEHHCNICEIFCDKKWSGNVLYNNKGFHTAGEWNRPLPPNIVIDTLIHIIDVSDNGIQHFQCKCSDISEAVKYIHRHEEDELYLCFHTAVILKDFIYTVTSNTSHGYEYEYEVYGATLIPPNAHNFITKEYEKWCEER